MDSLMPDEVLSARENVQIVTPDENTLFDVIIVGCGPVGMTCAIQLAQHGLKVAAVERYPHLPTVTRAGGVDAETVRTIQRLGLAEEFEKIARFNYQVKVLDRNHRYLQTFSAEAGTTLGWKTFYLVYLPELESMLYKKAVSLGVSIYMDQTAIDIQQSENGQPLDRVVMTCCRTSTQNEREEKYTLHGSYLIGADGARSFVREKVGIENVDLGMEPIHNLVIDFEHKNPDVDIPNIRMNLQILDTRQPQLIGRWNGGKWTRTEVRLPESRTYSSYEKDLFAWGALIKGGITPEHGRITRRSVYVCTSALARTWRQGRVLLAGDAAHAMPPHLGQGMLSGIRDTINLSWKLAAVIAGRADHKLLDTYETERSPHVRFTILGAMMMARLQLVSNPVLGWLRDNYLRFIQVPATPVWPPLKSFLVRNRDINDPTMPEGRLTVQCRVLYDGKIDLLDTFTGNSWKLITRHRVPQAVLDKYSAFMKAIDMRVMHVTRGTVDGAYIDIDGDYDTWFNSKKRKVCIQRPDNYCYATAEDIEGVSELLEQLESDLLEAGWSKHHLGAKVNGTTNGYKDNSVGSLTKSSTNESTESLMEVNSNSPITMKLEKLDLMHMINELDGDDH